MRLIPDIYEPLLAKVERPGRYVGGELNAVIKDPAGLRATIALAFPDLYDVGMSYHGFRILYERINARPEFAAERVYTPWPDFAAELRKAKLPLTTLETYRPLRDLDVVGFTLQHELNYTNVLEMLDLAEIPLRTEARSECFPIIIAGGEGAYSPEPMAGFIDAFALGDGEEVVFDILEAVALAKEQKLARKQILQNLARIPGVYVPSLYEVKYNADGTIETVKSVDPAAPAMVRPRTYDISRDLGSVRPVVPLIRTVQDRTVVEVRRGCVNGCRFCQAGMITRPVRERPVEQVEEIVRQSLENTGDDGVSLLSLSTADYTELGKLVRNLNRDLAERRISVSLPSLRISSFDVALAAELSSVRKSGFTFAPEAGSEKLRRIINKPLDEEEFLNIIEETLKAGWRTIKMYFMTGLPGETDEDLDGIVSIVRRAMDISRQLGIRNTQINITLSPFAPKAHTPFQWEGQIPREEIKRRLNYVRDHLPQRNVAFKTSPVDSSVLESALARGDRRLADVIERAWRNGCRFDGWREHLHPLTWWESFEACGLNAAWYAERVRSDDEVLPFDHIGSGPGKKFLALQRDLARQEKTTPDCVNNPCAGCDACARPRQHNLAKNQKASDLGSSDFSPTSSQDAPLPSASQSLGSELGSSDFSLPIPQDAPPPSKEKPVRKGSEINPSTPPVMRARLRFTKSGPLRFIGHLDLTEMIHRLLRLTGAPLAHSQGFNPQPHISLTPPLSLGTEGMGELADVYLVQRVSLKDLLKKINAHPLQGLDWTEAEEVPLTEPSLQQAIQQYTYRIAWREIGADEPVLPLDRAGLEKATQAFMSSQTWPIQIMRKEKIQERDARTFVQECQPTNPPEGYSAALEMVIRSDNGVTLNPTTILESIFKGNPATGVVLHIARLPIAV